MNNSINHYFELVANYRNDADHNDRLWQQFDSLTWANPLLARHRSHVEKHGLGFGDPAFHSMWQMLLLEAQSRFPIPRALEIGIFKGQVISLWALIAKQCNFDIEISALGPLVGQPRPALTWWNRLRNKFDPHRKEQLLNGNYYADEDYELIVREHFKHHDLDFDTVQLYRGYSTSTTILEQIKSQTFHLVYIDGDHSYEGAKNDFVTFAPKVEIGGWIIADDASHDLPGTVFWKGHPAVSRAVKVLPSLGFRNVLNIGHNRVFERVE